MGTKAALLELGRRLKAAGYQVGQNPAFGPVGVHAKGSLHYTGDAIDVNYDGHGQAFETAKLQAVVPLAKAAGLRVIWQTAGHYDHIHVDDGTGPDIGNIGNTGASSSSSSSSSGASSSTTATPAAFGLSLDEAAASITQAVIVTVAVLAGAGLVVLGVNKSTTGRRTP